MLNAVYVWGLATVHQAQVLFRIEDHDRIRSRPDHDAALREDLAWLGFEAAALTRQSERTAVYAAALDTLRQAASVYVCECSRREIGGERYDGRCRDRRLADGPGRGLRVRLDEGAESFDDLLLGPQEQRPSLQCGDLLIRDRDGQWTYQFAVTVDDWQQGITLVVRGADLLASTGRQLALARLLGRGTPPRFAHHPLIHDAGGAKLSKSAGDAGVRELRAAGLSPSGVIGLAAARGGLIDRPIPIAASEVGRLVVPAPRPHVPGPKMR